MDYPCSRLVHSSESSYRALPHIDRIRFCIAVPYGFGSSFDDVIADMGLEGFDSFDEVVDETIHMPVMVIQESEHFLRNPGDSFDPILKRGVFRRLYGFFQSDQLADVDSSGN